MKKGLFICLCLPFLLVAGLMAQPKVKLDVKNAKHYPRYIENNQTHQRQIIWWFPDFKGFVYCDESDPKEVRKVPEGYVFVDKKSTCTSAGVIKPGFHLMAMLNAGEMNQLLNRLNDVDKSYTPDMLAIKNDSTDVSLDLTTLGASMAYLATPHKTTIVQQPYVAGNVAAAAPDSYADGMEGVANLRYEIKFDLRSAVISTKYFGTLDRLVNRLRSTGERIIINGYASKAEGTLAYSLKLAANRADAVKTYLVNSGIDAQRLKTRSYGASHFAANDNIEEGQLLNSRVSFEKDIER